MSRITRSAVVNFGEVLSGNSYQLLLASTPAGSSVKKLRIAAHSLYLPAYGQQPIKTDLFGFSRLDRGRLEYENQMAVGFVDNQNADVYKSLMYWMMCLSSTDYGESTLSKDYYTTTAVLTVYDVTGTACLTIILYKFNLSKVNQVPLDGQSRPMSINAIFTYDYALLTSSTIASALDSAGLTTLTGILSSSVVTAALDNLTSTATSTVSSLL